VIQEFTGYYLMEHFSVKQPTIQWWKKKYGLAE